jgi:hypothetical protein
MIVMALHLVQMKLKSPKRRWAGNTVRLKSLLMFIRLGMPKKQEQRKNRHGMISLPSIKSSSLSLLQNMNAEFQALSLPTGKPKQRTS